MSLPAGQPSGFMGWMPPSYQMTSTSGIFTFLYFLRSGRPSQRLRMWSAIRQEQGGAALNFGRILRPQTDIYGVQDMTGHVHQRAGAGDSPPPAPVSRACRSRCRDASNGPVKRSQSRVSGTDIARPGRLRPCGQIGRSVKASTLFHLADFAVPYPFGDPPYSLPRRSLVAHLGRHSVFFRQLRHQPRLVHRVGQGLLYIHVLAKGHGVRGDDRVAWSAVATTTASISSCISSNILRQSRYLLASG